MVWNCVIRPNIVSDRPSGEKSAEKEEKPSETSSSKPAADYISDDEETYGRKPTNAELLDIDRLSVR